MNGACQPFVLPARDAHDGFQRIQVRSHLALQFVGGRRGRQSSRQALKQLTAQAALENLDVPRYGGLSQMERVRSS